MTVLGLHHVGLYVASLERSIAFYRDTFDLELAERFLFGGEDIAFLRLGGARLELLETDAQARRPTAVVDHLALEVDNLDAVVGRLRERGVPLLDEAPIAVPALGARILFCVGPDGERIELLEYDHVA
jgi:lactoylglutathione lyase